MMLDRQVKLTYPEGISKLMGQLQVHGDRSIIEKSNWSSFLPNNVKSSHIRLPIYYEFVKTILSILVQSLYPWVKCPN